MSSEDNSPVTQSPTLHLPIDPRLAALKKTQEMLSETHATLDKLREEREARRANAITVTRLRESLEALERQGHGDLHVWTNHPEYHHQWGPIRGIHGPCISDRFQRIAVIDPCGGEADEDELLDHPNYSDPFSITLHDQSWSVTALLNQWIGSANNANEDKMDHDSYMISPDDHKPNESSPTLSTNDSTSQPTPLRMPAAAAGIELGKLVADLNAAKTAPFELQSQPVSVSGNGDDHVAGEGEKWAFDEKVTSVFDKMLEASIPNYQEMRRLSFALGKRFIPESNGVIIDIGASRGDALVPFVDAYPDHNYYAIEVSEPMREVMAQRFNQSGQRNVTIVDHDLRRNHSAFEVKSDLILSVLTLMFIPIELRQRLLQAMYDSLKPGSALILVEKCLGSDSRLNDMLVDSYYDMKREHGYTQEQIYRKKLALEGVLVPVTPEWNIDMLRRAGFKHIETFWKSLMFTGFIAIKA